MRDTALRRSRLALLFCLLGPPAIFAGVMASLLSLRGCLDTNANYRGGRVLASYAWARGGLFVSRPEGVGEDTVPAPPRPLAFSVSLVDFPFGGLGQGIEDRLNLVLDFEAPASGSRPAGPRELLGSRAFHVYLDRPAGRPDGLSSPGGPISPRAAAVAFERDWELQVILDPFHDQARIYDAQGRYLGQSSSSYLRPRSREEGRATGPELAAERADRISLVVSLPLSLVGDPREGGWSCSVLAGLADPWQASSLLLPEQGYERLIMLGRPVEAAGRRDGPPILPALPLDGVRTR